MTFQGIRDGFSHWLAERVAAPARLRPHPGWYLGSGERVSNGLWTGVRRQLWRALKTPTLIPWLEGLRVFLYPGNETSRALFVTGLYEPNEFCLLDRILRPGMTFIDVGANMGLYALFAARKVQQQGLVLALEPSSREFQRLKRNVEANLLANVRLLQLGVFNCRSEAELLIAADPQSGHNTLGAFAYDTPLEATERVSLDRLHDIIEREGLTRVDVVKMDIEGAELCALEGAAEVLARFHPVVLLELSDRSLRRQRCSSAQVWEFLCQSGYRIYAFDERTGLPLPARQKPYFDSENVVAVHALAKPPLPW